MSQPSPGAAASATVMPSGRGLFVSRQKALQASRSRSTVLEAGIRSSASIMGAMSGWMPQRSISRATVSAIRRASRAGWRAARRP